MRRAAVDERQAKIEAKAREIARAGVEAEAARRAALVEAAALRAKATAKAAAIMAAAEADAARAALAELDATGGDQLAVAQRIPPKLGGGGKGAVSLTTAFCEPGIFFSCWLFALKATGAGDKR